MPNVSTENLQVLAETLCAFGERLNPDDPQPISPEDFCNLLCPAKAIACEKFPNSTYCQRLNDLAVANGCSCASS